MSDKEQLLRDELRGLLMESFEQSTRTDFTKHAANGRMIYLQMKRGQDLFDRIKALGAAEAKPPQPAAQPKEKTDGKDRNGSTPANRPATGARS